MKRKLIYRIFAITLLLTVILPALPVGAAENKTSWSLDVETMELTIFGNGDMPNFDIIQTKEWNAYKHSIRMITIEEGVTSIGDYAFYDFNFITQIEIPDSVKYVGSGAFCSCDQLMRVGFGDGSRVTRIGEGAFFECAVLTDIEIPDSVTSIGKEAFSYCKSLQNIEIPDGVTSIDWDMFSDCKNLTSVKFGSNSQLKSIGNRAFKNCGSLKNIEIPAGVTSLGERTFVGCTSLAAITYRGTRQQWDQIEKGSNWCSANVKITCHKHAYGAWKITKAPTDTAEGMKERSCACGYKEYEVIPLPETEPTPTDTTAPERDTEAVPTDTTNETVSSHYLEQAYDVFRQIYDPFHLLPSGCGSSIASPALFCVISIGAACLLRRKKD